MPELPEADDILDEHGSRRRSAADAGRQPRLSAAAAERTLLLEDQRDLYENTAVSASNLTLSVGQ